MSQVILDRVAQVGGVVFDNGDYDLNLVGIRSKSTESNQFNDALYAIYKERGMWIARWWPITTDPGLYWLHNPGNRLGTAAVVADRQYRRVWTIGKHRNKYTALVQTGEISVHRDNNLDAKVDYEPDNIQTGYFGINCHRATTGTGGSVNVDKWSAGCQVFSKPQDFSAFMAICEKQVSQRGWESFTYTLLNEW